MSKLMMICKKATTKGWDDTIWVELLFGMHRASLWDKGKILQMDHEGLCSIADTHNSELHTWKWLGCSALLIPASYVVCLSRQEHTAQADQELLNLPFPDKHPESALLAVVKPAFRQNRVWSSC